MSRLKEKYQKEVVPALKKEFGYANAMAIPKIRKVVITGKDAGKRGRVLRIVHGKNRLVVEGVTSVEEVRRVTGDRLT